MNSTDLIERLDEMCATDEGTLWPHDVMQCLIDCRAALSPVMPPEVDAAIKFYRDPEQGANRITANLLEKLYRENRLLKAEIRCWIFEEKEQLQQRNEELERWNAEMVAKAAGGGTLDAYREQGEKMAALESQRDQLAEELEDQLQYHQEEAVTLENRIEEVVAANDKERARVNKLTSQRDQLAEAIETLGTKGFLSFEDRAAFARAEHKRIMREK